jgi:hypothetical protein
VLDQDGVENSSFDDLSMPSAGSAARQFKNQGPGFSLVFSSVVMAIISPTGMGKMTLADLAANFRKHLKTHQDRPAGQAF